MQTYFVNIFAGPGAGKSTLAAGLFWYMKQRGEKCELVREFAKELVWTENFRTLDCRSYVTGKQIISASGNTHPL